MNQKSTSHFESQISQQYGNQILCKHFRDICEQGKSTIFKSDCIWYMYMYRYFSYCEM